MKKSLFALIICIFSASCEKSSSYIGTYSGSVNCSATTVNAAGTSTVNAPTLFFLTIFQDGSKTLFDCPFICEGTELKGNSTSFSCTTTDNQSGFNTTTTYSGNVKVSSGSITIDIIHDLEMLDGSTQIQRTTYHYIGTIPKI